MSKTYSKTRILVECALMIAIGTVLSNIKFFTLPNGGSVTLLSMLPFVLVSFRHGVKWGLFTGFVNGCLQMLLGFWAPPTPTFLYFLGEVLLDYLVAFMAAGADEDAGQIHAADRHAGLPVFAGAADQPADGRGRHERDPDDHHLRADAEAAGQGHHAGRRQGLTRDAFRKRGNAPPLFLCRFSGENGLRICKSGFRALWLCRIMSWPVREKGGRCAFEWEFWLPAFAGLALFPRQRN